MIRRSPCAALLVSLAFASAAKAQVAPYGPTLTTTPTERLFDGTRAGVSVGKIVGVEQSGQVETRRRIVGQVGVAPDVEVGVGLFSVIRDSRERRISRANPMREVGGRERTIVAAGMTLRF
jgi:hypothetical protein